MTPAATSLSHPRHNGAPVDRPLNVRERLFVDEYLIDLNGARAAGRAGYSWSRQAGFRLLRRPNVVAAIERGMTARAERVGITVDRVLQEVAWMAFARLDSVANWGVRADGKAFVEVKPPQDLSPMQAAVIAEVKVTAGGMGVRMHNKVDALTLLMRHMGMLKDRVDLSVADETQDTVQSILTGILGAVPADLRAQLRPYLMPQPGEGAAGAAGA